MNYILLSGGSGKSLWPLSNEIRLKQFIKILKKDNGTYESMVERVYRQIKSVDNDSNITIATSESQVPTLRNQLGENIDISVEPCRRDTFPAIILALLYLKDVKKVDENEIVIISSVNLYVEDDFFKTLNKLDDKMKTSTNNIGLIGIKSTCQSKVEEKNLIKNTTLLNGGVFCFKLKYIIDKAHELIEFKDYNDLYNKYDKLKNISFESAIVEKEKNIDIVSFDGEWKNIGTWNTLTEVISDKSIGKVLFDENSENTNIINELDIPIIGMGLKNIVVAASYDGIFVSNKNVSNNNKTLVDKLDNRPMYEDRAWGDFKVIDVYKKSLVKHLFIKAGKSISYQKHNHRDEVWIIIDGNGILTLNDVEKEVNMGDVIKIKKGDKHAIRATNDLHFIEVQYGDMISEDDIDRFE